MSRRWAWRIGLLLAVFGLVLLAWRWSGSSRSQPVVPVLAPASATAASAVRDGAPRSGIWALVEQASVQADLKEADAKSEKAFLLDPKNDTAWCELGPPRLAQSLNAQRDADGAGRPQGAAAEALAETAEALLQRWAAQLTARADAASLAMRDFLLANIDVARLLEGASGHSEQRSASAARLMQTGLVSSDGFAMRLAAQQACRKSESPLCPQILRRWWQLEPLNLDAQLWRLSSLPESTDDSQWVPFLSQATKADQGESHRERYLQIVAQLMEVDGPAGLRSTAALQLATAAVSLQTDSRLFFLADRCRLALSAEAKAVCVAVAERLYVQPFRPALARMVAAAIGREQAANSEVWRQREEEVLALRYWGRESRDLNREQMWALRAGACQLQPMLSDLLRRATQKDELADMHESLAARGLDVKGFLAETRAKK